MPDQNLDDLERRRSSRPRHASHHGSDGSPEGLDSLPAGPGHPAVGPADAAGAIPGAVLGPTGHRRPGRRGATPPAPLSSGPRPVEVIDMAGTELTVNEYGRSDVAPGQNYTAPEVRRAVAGARARLASMPRPASARERDAAPVRNTLAETIESQHHHALVHGGIDTALTAVGTVGGEAAHAAHWAHGEVLGAHLAPEAVAVGATTALSPGHRAETAGAGVVASALNFLAPGAGLLVNTMLHQLQDGDARTAAAQADTAAMRAREQRIAGGASVRQDGYGAAANPISGDQIQGIDWARAAADGDYYDGLRSGLDDRAAGSLDGGHTDRVTLGHQIRNDRDATTTMQED